MITLLVLIALFVFSAIVFVPISLSVSIVLLDIAVAAGLIVGVVKLFTLGR